MAIAGLSSADISTSQAPTPGPVVPAYQQSGYIQHTSYPYSEGFESGVPYNNPDLQNTGPPSRSVVSTNTLTFDASEIIQKNLVI